MSSFIKALQITTIILLIVGIILFNKDTFSLKSLSKYLSVSTKKTKTNHTTAELFESEKCDSEDLFNTDYNVTEDMGDAISDALKSVV
jgi:hypothetical protein